MMWHMQIVSYQEYYYTTTDWVHYSHSTALCPDPTDLVNGMVTSTGNSVGDTATYTCNSGFELVGNATATCTQMNMNSTVFSPIPECRRECCLNITRSV